MKKNSKTKTESDIYNVLKNDHREVKALLKEIEALEESTKRDGLFEKLKANLLAHSHAEDEVFYEPLKEKLEDDVYLVFEAKEEHKLVEQLLNELSESLEDDVWCAKFKVLKEMVEHHIEEEEEDLFKKAKKVISPEESEQMAQEMLEKEKAELDEAA